MRLSFNHEFISGVPANDAKCCERGKDPSKPMVADLIVLAWNVYIHTPYTRHQVHRDEDRTQRRQLREDIIDLVVSIRHLDRNLRQVVGVRP